MNRERLLALADILDRTPNAKTIDARRALPDDVVGFDMGSFYYSDTIFCGTTACIAGHAILAFGTPEDKAELVSDRREVGWPGLRAQDLLDLPDRDLFFQWNLDAAGAAAALRALAGENAE